jgi:hypothetical protein
MSGPRCAREADVLRTIGRGWDDEADAGLAEHVGSCGRCTEVRAAGELLRAEHVRETAGARVPSAAAMWWRLDRRLRAEDARRLQRMALATQALVLAAAAGGAVGVLQVAAPWLPGPARMASDTWSGIVWMLGTWPQPSASFWTLPVAIAAAAWLLLVPVALYLGFSDE